MTEGNGEVRELPKGWALTTVGEAIKIIDYRGRTPPYSEDGIPHLRSSNIRNRKIVWEDLRYVSEETYQAYMTRGLPEKDDVLFTTEAPLGEVALAPDQRFSLAQRMMILRPNKDLLSSKFLLYQIEDENFQKKLKNSGTGTTVTGVSSRNFQPISILLAPIYEQERIVEKIEELFSELDQGIENLKTAQKQLKVYRQAVLKWAFEGKLTEQWRQQAQQQGTLKTGEELLAQIKAERENRYQQQVAAWEAAVKTWEANGKPGKKPSKPSKPKDLAPLPHNQVADLPSLPDSWKWIQLGEVLDDIEAGKSFRCEERPPRANEIGVAKVSAVTWGEYDESESKTCLEQDKTEEKFLIEAEDFLFSRANTIELVGACVIAKRVTLRVMLSDKTLRFKFSKSINQKFILHFLKSRYGRNEIERLATGNQESMRNIGQDRILRIRTPFPHPFEQEQIVQEIESRLSNCDQLETTIAENLQKAEALRQSILKQAFEGKLVPQDPTDEPAEKLLERIRAEKAKRQPPGKQMTIKMSRSKEDANDLED
ncbi:MAG: restriction endonuclease subunit S [Leptolyngbyaceae cyanobacterium bins.302]|nr:restriction endonuclease subunit S [Leptolyngbyaceae cyanobacterium bins.302]